MKHLTQAVILAGGLGTRLRPLTETEPKPMIRFFDKPFLQYLIEILKNNGITRILLLVGYRHETIEEYFGDGSRFGVFITYSYDPPQTDTGTRIARALDFIDRHFLLLYGDNLWPLRIDELIDSYNRVGLPALVTVYRNSELATKNNVYVNEKSIVEIYDRARENTRVNGVDIGFFLLDKRVFTPCPKDNFSFEDVILSRLVGQKMLAAFVTDHKYYGLSNLKRTAMIESYLTPKKVVFLDRDGVINKRPKKASYVTSWREFSFLPRAIDALVLLKRKGYSMYIVTNQPAVARGVMEKKQLDAIHSNLCRELKKRGIVLSGIYSCLHGWNDGCACRKPQPGLFFQVAREHAINLTESICIGDDGRDIMAGKRAACKTIYIGTTPKDSFSPDERPDFVYTSLFEAAVAL